MIGVGLAMMRRRGTAGDPAVRLTFESASHLLPVLFGIGFAVGLFSGFLGIGGGFLIVPGLVLATGMPLAYAWFTMPIERPDHPALTAWYGRLEQRPAYRKGVMTALT